MNSLFPDELVKNKEADEPWKKSETDKMLDLYLAGSTPSRVAVLLGRNPKAIKRRLEQFTYNERERATRYEPVQRTSRKGTRLTENERLMIQSFKKRHLPMKDLAKVLLRDVNELGLSEGDLNRLGDMRKLGTGVDLTLAYRYLYYVQGISILSDEAYDRLEKEETEFGAGGQILEKMVGSDKSEDYPPHIRALGLYLGFKYGTKRNENLARP